MDDLSTHVVLFTDFGSLAKRAVWKWTTPKKKIKKSKLYLVRTKSCELSRLSWC